MKDVFRTWGAITEFLDQLCCKLLINVVNFIMKSVDGQPVI
jgi:hypothetical protein